jgi:phytoene synthase
MINYDWLEGDMSDLTACREMLQQGSHSFFAASLLLPWEVREPACALYAFCRLADDLIDDSDGDRHAMDTLTRRLDLIYEQRPFDHPADRALAQVVRLYAIPKIMLEALLEGFEWDVSGRRYDTRSDLFAYAARVAATVGAMMSMLMGGRRADVLARACDLGVAMQLTNIARDVGEDARAGRLYLPREWLDDAGIDADAFLDAPQFTPALASVVQRLLATADALYLRARSGIAQLPVACRPGIYAAMRIYREIGMELRRNGLDSVSTRTVVSRGRKSFLLGHAMLSTIRPKPADTTPPLPEVRFLVDGACESGAPMPAHEVWFD